MAEEPEMAQIPLKRATLRVVTTTMETATLSSTGIRRRGRRLSVAAVVAAAAFILSACLTPQQSEVLDRLNADRRAYGLQQLGVQGDAQAKAQAWAEKLAREGRIYHSNLSDGIKVRWCNLGENVGYGASVASIQSAYMGSSGHRANVLSSTWNGVGVGYAQGKVNGHNVVFTVQVFIRTC